MYKEERKFIVRKYAHKMRFNLTPAESLFYKMISKKRVPSKCQHVIHPYIADFMIFRGYTKIVIEIDGGYHFTPNQIKKDEIRSEFIKSKGYEIIRIKNEDVPRLNVDYFLKILGMHNKIRKEKDSNGAIKNIRYSDYSNVELYKSVA